VSLSLHEWLSLLESRHPRTIDLGLERCREVWQRMAAPRPARRIFMVAGTNGKGSTVACLDGMLRSLDYSCGSYTSPHLLRYNERIQVNGAAVSDKQLVEAFERVEASRRDISLSYFEFGTLAAFSILHQADLDFAVLEVGLGGRLDAVNMLDADCAVITNIGLDHQEYLGDDRESIGREKAGIIRRNTPLVCGEADPPVSVMAKASRLHAPVMRLGMDFEIRLSGEEIHFTQGDVDFLLPGPPMTGQHQLNNLALALAALLKLVPDASNHTRQLAAGITAVSLPGRLQQICDQPRIYVDVGHNPLAAKAVFDALSKHPGRDPEAQCHCVIGMLADKDAGTVAKILDSLVSVWYCAGLDGDRGQSGEELARRIRAAVANAAVISCATVEMAFDAALEAVGKACPSSDCVLVFGSFLTAGQAIARWRLIERSNFGEVLPHTELDADRIP
jgi:dihydrofolate synthase/folylpolyglutamate synthase